VLKRRDDPPPGAAD
jgi:citrate/tricarballylate utilization protein